MKAGRTIRNGRPEKGIALLISIFVLLLISVVAISLIVSSGTETSLAGNYRSATSVNYAALAGLEEARGRLLAKSPNSIITTAPGFLPTAGGVLPVGNVLYILNPGPGEAAGSILATYPDNEYQTEFGAAPNPANVTPISSVWNMSPLNALNVPGPPYKWGRINALSEVSLGYPVAPFDGHVADPAKPIYFDGTRLTITSTGAQQVLEITSLAVLPNRSQKIVQYLATPAIAQNPLAAMPPFLAALTLSDGPGNNATFQAPAKNPSYVVKGDDQDCNGNPTGAKFRSIGVFLAADAQPGSSVLNGIQPNAKNQYTGVNSSPDVEDISGSYSPTPSQLDALVQTIAQNADAVITPSPSSSPPYLGTASGSSLTPLGMKSGNPLIIVVNGNLDITGWNNNNGNGGYGLLVVTGTFTYDPDTNWNGIILVIGQGIVKGSHTEYKQINGAMFVAKTRDASGNLLPDPSLGGASVQFDDDMQGNGIRYSSCWIQLAQPTPSYKILSFHEIAQ